jgi:diacylglycerol kinase family enzyme
MHRETGPIEDFKRLLIVTNPASTQSQRPCIQRQIETLVENVTEYDFLDTTVSSAENVQNVRMAVKDGTIVCGIGGDGTIGMLGKALATEELQGRNISLAAFGGGNANDFARSLNGTLRQTSMLEVIRRGQRVPVTPIRTTIERPHTTDIETQLALNCLGFGGSAHISHFVNDAKYRRSNGYEKPWKRFLHESVNTIEALQTLQPFTIQREGRQPETRYELTFANSDRMGKVARPPVTADDERCYKIELESNRLLTVAGTVGRLVLGKMPREREHYLHPGEAYAFKLRTSGTHAHFDGEVSADDRPFVYEAGTTFTIDQHDYPVHVLKTL